MGSYTFIGKIKKSKYISYHCAVASVKMQGKEVGSREQCELQFTEIVSGR